MRNAFVLFAFAAALIVLPGCDTFEKRAQEKSAAFGALDAGAQEKLKRGVIEIGNTPDMVYIALGEPDEKKSLRTGDADQETWIYNSYYREYAGTAHVGYERRVAYDPKTKRYFVYHEPVVAELYRDEQEERIRVIFRDGRVFAIEQPKMAP